MIFTYTNELYHHGIKGQKWGVRRFQRKDGTRTAAGKKHQRELQSNNSEEKTNTTKLKTAEKEYSGEKLKKATNEYRAKMLKKYAGNDKEKFAFYTNASDDVIKKEFLRRENVKKAVIAGAAVVGITAACVIAYKISCDKQLNGIGNGPNLKESIKNAMKKANEDLDYVIPKGSKMHRMVGSEGYDLSKTVGKLTYVTATESDRAAYGLFLKDWSGTGKRYDVTLEAVRDIRAPSDKRAKEIFKKVWDENPEYRKELENTLKETYASFKGVSKDDILLETAVRRQLLIDPFGEGMYAIVRQGKDSKILSDAYKKAGYDAIIDYFDKGKLGKQPMILLDAASSTVKTGEQFVDRRMRNKYTFTLLKDFSHPMHKYLF